LIAEFGTVEHCINALRHRPNAAPGLQSMLNEYEIVVAAPAVWLDALQSKQETSKLRSIVHVSSVLARFVSRGQSAAYHCAKAAQEALVRWQAVSWGPHGTRVNAVAPGFIAPDDRRPDKAEIEATFPRRVLSASHAQENPASMRSICEAVAFLLDAEGITGQVLTIDGGSSVLEALGVAIDLSTGPAGAS
jgi:NAD(P)-dependent dehydrogenase (short-subunit alcohol dehydrogenase family)